MTRSFSYSQTAKMLAVSVDTVRDMVAAGRLDCFTIGVGSERRHRRISEDEIERLQNQGKRSPRSTRRKKAKPKKEWF